MMTATNNPNTTRSTRRRVYEPDGPVRWYRTGWQRCRQLAKETDERQRRDRFNARLDEIQQCSDPTRAAQLLDNLADEFPELVAQAVASDLRRQERERQKAARAAEEAEQARLRWEAQVDHARRLIKKIERVHDELRAIGIDVPTTSLVDEQPLHTADIDVLLLDLYSDLQNADQRIRAFEDQQDNWWSWTNDTEAQAHTPKRARNGLLPGQCTVKAWWRDGSGHAKPKSRVRRVKPPWRC